MNCIKCKATFDKAKEVVVDMGFSKIIQSQCPRCGFPISTDIKNTGTLVFTEDGVKIDKKCE